MDDLDDVRLLAGLKEGDAAALHALSVRCWERFYKHARRSADASPEDAEEIAQDAMIRVLRDIHRFEGRARLDTWLYRVVSNTCKDFRKARRNQYLGARPGSTVELDERRADEPGVIAGCPPRSPEASAICAEDRDLLRDHLAQLNRRHQAVLACRQLHGLTVEETARELDMTKGAVKMATLRAMEALTKSLRRSKARSELKGGGAR